MGTRRTWLMEVASGTTLSTGAANVVSTGGTAATTVSAGTGGTVISDNAHPYQGSTAAKFTTGSAASLIRLPVASFNLSHRVSFVDWRATVASTTQICGIRSNAAYAARIQITNTGVVQILNSANTAVGSSAASAYTGSIRNRIEITLTVATSTTGTMTVNVYNESNVLTGTVTKATENYGTVNIEALDIGYITAPTSAVSAWVDAIQTEDGTGVELGPYASKTRRDSIGGSNQALGRSYNW